MSGERRRYFATAAAGLEEALEAELRGLRWPSIPAASIRRARGGVAFEGDREAMMAACLHLRTASRVLWNLAEIRVRSAEDLYEGARREVRWRGLVTPAHTLAVDATVREAAIPDSRFAALKLKDAIVDTVRDAEGTRPDVDAADPDVQVHLRLVGDRGTISLDASGAGLHQRGYRTEAGEAPLRETMAAAALLLAGWTGDGPLVDPLAGSGTLVLEGGLLATRTAPGLIRARLGLRSGFERWPGHKAARWEKLLESARAAVRPAPAPLLGRDHDAAIVDVARQNAKRAGLEGQVSFERANAATARPPEGFENAAGLLVANPPWGERLGDAAALVPLYETLGRLARGPFAAWRAAFLVGDDTHLRALGAGFDRRFPLRSGPLDLVLAVRVP